LELSLFPIPIKGIDKAVELPFTKREERLRERKLGCNDGCVRKRAFSGIFLR
jgi:hypothetical protein